MTKITESNVVLRDPALDAHFEIRDYPGYHTPFTKQQSPLAKYPNGLRVVKTALGKGDMHPVGTRGTVLGSIGMPEIGVGYFVEWDVMPQFAVFITEPRIGPA